MNKIESSKRAILGALLRGCRLTAYDANVIGKTTAGARRIREIRKTYPVLKESVAGEMYCRYYIDPAWLEEYRKNKKRPLGQRIGEFFDDLLRGGMFDTAKA